MAQAAAAAEEPLEPAPEATPLPSGMARIVEPYKGDLDGMIKRRVIRVLTVQNPILYFVDRGREVRDHVRGDQGVREAAQRQAATTRS